MRAVFAAGLVAGALTLAACSSSGSAGNASVTENQPTPNSSTNAYGCAPAPTITTTPQVNKYSSEPPLTIARTTYTARIVTNCGTITIAMDGAKAPHTVNSFTFLAGKGYFTDTPCHRLTTAGIYVLQCGDPTGSGGGGPGYQFQDENLAGAKYVRGTVAMANAGANTNGSQFFLVYRDSTQLSASYTPFGRVIAGMKVLDNIARAGSDNPTGRGDGRPNQPVVIESFTVTKG